MTAEIIFKSSQLGLVSNALNFQEWKEIIVFDTRELARLKAFKEYTMQKAASLEIIALNKLIAACGVKELKALVHYKKRKDDRSVPSTKADLLEKYEDICCCADQTLDTYLSIFGHK